MNVSNSGGVLNMIVKYCWQEKWETGKKNANESMRLKLWLKSWKKKNPGDGELSVLL